MVRLKSKRELRQERTSPPPEKKAAGGMSWPAIRITRHADIIDLYFPPLRAPEVGLALAMFGLACLGLPLLAVFNYYLPAAGSGAHEMLVIALVGAFVVPFPVFGMVFVGLAVYMLANSMTVSVSPTAIAMTRRVLGFLVARRELAIAEVASIEPQIVGRHQSLFGGAPYFRLIARHVARRKSDMIVAESLKGEPMMSRVRDLIVGHTGLATR